MSQPVACRALPGKGQAWRRSEKYEGFFGIRAGAKRSWKPGRCWTRLAAPKGRRSRTRSIGGDSSNCRTATTCSGKSRYRSLQGINRSTACWVSWRASRGRPPCGEWMATRTVWGRSLPRLLRKPPPTAACAGSAQGPPRPTACRQKARQSQQRALSGKHHRQQMLQRLACHSQPRAHQTVSSRSLGTRRRPSAHARGCS